MKKKILLIIALVMVLACLFAISISAEMITYDGQEIELVNNLGEPSWYTGTTATKIQDKESIVILKDTEGNMTAYPSYYLFRYLIDNSGVRIAWANDKGVDYSFVNEKTGKNYTSGSMYYVELPYGLTTCTAYNVWGKGKAEPNVVEFVIPDSVTTISNNAFAEINNCKKVTISKNVKTIDEWSFYNSKDLEMVVFPEGCAVQTIGKGSFRDCVKLSSINFENCQSLKTLGDLSFENCAGIDKLYLPNSLQSIGMQALINLGVLELASDYLPKSLTYIGENFLSNCQLKNEVLYFPEGFTSLGSRYNFIGTFKPDTSLTLVFLGKMTYVNLSDTPLTNFTTNGSKQPIRLVFAQNTFSDLSGEIVPLVDYNGQNGFVFKYADGSPLYTTNEGTLTITLDNWSLYNGTNLGNDVSGNVIYLADSPTEFIFCGGDTVEISYSVRNNHTNKGWYRFHTTTKTYDVNSHIDLGIHFNNREVQEGNCGYDEVAYNTCVICNEQSTLVVTPATGLHIYTDDFNCESALTCEICQLTIKEAMTHIMASSIDYANGYANVGLKTVFCKNEGCTVCNSKEETNSLFLCLGYSVQETGRIGLVIGYKVNKDTLAEFTKITGKTVKYGVFAILKAKLGDGDIFSQDCIAAEGAICADVTNYQFVAFELKIFGFSDEQKDTKLALGAYVAVFNGENVEYSYMQSGTPNEGEKYCFVSYNDIVGK